MSISIILSLCGGLGLFLFGMNMMSESIEKVAGAKLRRILEIFTSNKFTGMLVGVVFTGIVQSSAACTVMVVSFVNAGLMNLTQAAGVILGANIGTTVTSQLISFNLSEYAPVILLTGVLLIMFSKKDQVKRIAEVIIGFGILFVGLDAMYNAMEGLQDVPFVVNLLRSLTNPFFATIVGFLLTAAIQSSSVTVSIVLLLASQDFLELPITLYIILGCNIGSCVTSLLASMTGKKDAKRAAMIHFLFNVIGTVIIYIILLFAENQVVAFISAISANNGRFVANAHTLIKVFQVVILLPFTKQLVQLACLVVPGKDEKISYRESYQLKYIGGRVVFNPATAVIQVMKELDRMATLAGENLNRAMNALITLDEDDIEEVKEVEKNINFLSRSITDYLVRINQTTLPIEDLKSIGSLFYVVNDIERISDIAQNIAEMAETRGTDGTVLSEGAQRELGEMLELVDTMILKTREMFKEANEPRFKEVIRLENRVDEMERELQRGHVERLTSGECTPAAGMLFSDVVSGLERVADYTANIANSVYNGEKAVELDDIK